MTTYTKASIGAKILVIDFETSGSSFKSYKDTFQQFQGISFGAVVADSQTFEPIETLYREIKFDDKYTWSAEAEGIHGLSREHLNLHGVSAEEAATDLAGMIFTHFHTGKVAFLGHNTNFDIEASRQLLEPFGVMPEVHHVVLDTSPLGFITIGEYKSDKVFEFFTGTNRGQHNALDDALICLETVRNVRAIVDSVLRAEK